MFSRLVRRWWRVPTTNPLLAGVPPAAYMFPVSLPPKKTTGNPFQTTLCKLKTTIRKTASGQEPKTNCSEQEVPIRGNLLRTPAEQAGLVAALQLEFGDHLQPSAHSSAWPAVLLRRWFQDGGAITVDALSSREMSSEEYTATATSLQQGAFSLIDEVGADYDVRDLSPLPLEGGLLGALRRSDSAALSALASQLGEDNFVCCRLGVDEPSRVQLTAECASARPFMRPGELQTSDGGVVSGRSPSGSLRGDKYVLFRSLPKDIAWPILTATDEALGSVTSSLSPLLKDQGLSLSVRSDTFVACFPGDGLGYNAHFDGDDKCKITCIFYPGSTSEWRKEHGGRVLLLDEKQRCWWAVPPHSDMLVLFRSDRVLHKVERCFHVPRFALTVFLSLGRSAAEIEHERALVAKMVGSYM